MPPAPAEQRADASTAEVGRAGVPGPTPLAEWPPEADEPAGYWLSTLPEDTPISELVRLAKIRWRIEHDYRELKTGLGLDHFEGRSFTGWHCHVTLATLALSGASGASTDIMRKLALAARSTPGLEDVANDLFPDPPRTTIFQPEPGCGEPTFRGSANEVQALASQLLAGALGDLMADEAGEQIDPLLARVARLPYAAGRRARDLITWANDEVVVDTDSGYQIRFAPRALDGMQDEAFGTSYALGPDVETGGMLLGQIDDARGVVWVTSIAAPTPGSEQSSSYVRLAAEYTRELLTVIEDESSGRISFIGMWHTHPHAVPFESQTDQDAVRALLTNKEHPLHRVLLVIVGGEPAAWDAWLTGDGPPAIYARLAARATKTG